MKISIVIPAYNESARIGASLKKIFSYIESVGVTDSVASGREEPSLSEYEFEVVVVVDGQVDSTAEIVSEDFPQVKLVSYPDNKGKGFALKQGVAQAVGDLIYICDADLSTSIEQLPKFIRTMQPKTQKYDVVIGSRALDSSVEQASKLRKSFGKVGNKLINLALNLGIKDTQCGFKLFTKEAADSFEDLRTFRWGFDFELLYLIKSRGLRITEVPVDWVAESQHSQFRLSGYFTTLAELILVWWRHIRFSKSFWQGLWEDRIVRYGFVGVATNVIKFGVASLLTFFGVLSAANIGGLTLTSEDLSYTVGYLACLIFNFSAHKLLTFKDQLTKFKLGEVARYIVLVGLNLLIELITQKFFIETLGVKSYLAYIVAILFGVVWNFFFLKLFVYDLSTGDRDEAVSITGADSK